MKGYYVARKAGWDTHGLPVEIEVEKMLGINSKKEIEKIGIEKFNKLCKESVMKYEDEWKRMTERIGFWIDLDNAYFTFKNEYIETVWWILKTFWNKGLLYEGYKVVPYCPRCGTALSSHEVAQGYKDTEDYTIIVKFPIKGENNKFLLVWTTTPWTLISNVACAINKDHIYEMCIRDRSYRDIPFPRMSNTFIDNGDEDPIQIIKSVKKGIYAKEFLGGQVDPATGDFVFGISEGYLIENGSITNPIKGATLIGNGPEVLKKIVAVGGDLDFSPGFCGKNGQSIPCLLYTS